MTTPPKTAAELFGVRRVPKNARDRLLDKAIDLFYAHGFNAVGLDRIIAEVGVTKTTFYKHFASKDDLMAEAVRVRDQWETRAWQRACRKLAGDDPRAQLLAMFDVLHLWFNDPDFRGCLFLNAAAEFPNPNDPIHQIAAAHKRRTRNYIRDLAARAGAADPESFADVYIMLFEGTLVLRQVHDRNDAAKVARGVVEKLIRDQIPEPQPLAA